MLKYLKKDIFIKYSKTAEFILDSFRSIPKLALVAGSGIADALEGFEILHSIEYKDIPGMPQSSVQGHGGELQIVKIGDVEVLVFTGRFHAYENRTNDEICSLSIISACIGVKGMIFTNAAGAVNKFYQAGELMLIDDVINQTYRSIHTMFYPEYHLQYKYSQDIFDKEWIKQVKRALIHKQEEINIGIYQAMLGPTYETPAEIRMLQTLGIDAVGMSTVLEARCAHILGLKVIGASVLTNKLNGINSQKLTHDEVLGISKTASARIKSFLIECTKGFIY